MQSAVAARSPAFSPRFSFATVNDPPPFGYAGMVCPYEIATSRRTTAIAAVMGPMNPRAPAPRGIKTVSAASGPYDADASASSPSTGTAGTTPIRSASCSSDRSGRPKRKWTRRIRTQAYSRRDRRPPRGRYLESFADAGAGQAPPRIHDVPERADDRQVMDRQPPQPDVRRRVLALEAEEQRAEGVQLDVRRVGELDHPIALARGERDDQLAGRGSVERAADLDCAFEARHGIGGLHALRASPNGRVRAMRHPASVMARTPHLRIAPVGVFPTQRTAQLLRGGRDARRFDPGQAAGARAAIHPGHDRGPFGRARRLRAVRLPTHCRVQRHLQERASPLREGAVRSRAAPARLFRGAPHDARRVPPAGPASFDIRRVCEPDLAARGLGDDAPRRRVPDRRVPGDPGGGGARMACDRAGNRNAPALRGRLVRDSHTATAPEGAGPWRAPPARA